MVVLDESDPRVLLSGGRKEYEHCRHFSPTALRGLAESAERFALCLGWWIKAVLQATLTHGLAVYLGQRNYFQGSCCCWNLDHTSLQALQSLDGCVCLLHTNSSILKLLAAPKAVSHIPYK